MGRPMSSSEVTTLLQTVDGETMVRLLRLLERISVDETTGDLTIATGAARIVLTADGTVRIAGARIVQDAERDVAIRAAWIDLN